jgi:hypothetical protein
VLVAPVTWGNGKLYFLLFAKDPAGMGGKMDERRERHPKESMEFKYYIWRSSLR